MRSMAPEHLDFGCVCAAMGFYPLTPMYNTWLALQNAGQSKRAAAMGFSLVFTQSGGILGSNIFLQNQAREFHTASFVIEGVS